MAYACSRRDAPSPSAYRDPRDGPRGPGIAGGEQPRAKPQKHPVAEPAAIEKPQGKVGGISAQGCWSSIDGGGTLRPGGGRGPFVETSGAVLIHAGPRAMFPTSHPRAWARPFPWRQRRDCWDAAMCGAGPVGDRSWPATDQPGERIACDQGQLIRIGTSTPRASWRDYKPDVAIIGGVWPGAVRERLSTRKIRPRGPGGYRANREGAAPPMGPAPPAPCQKSMPRCLGTATARRSARTTARSQRDWDPRSPIPGNAVHHGTAPRSWFSSPGLGHAGAYALPRAHRRPKLAAPEGRPVVAGGGGWPAFSHRAGNSETAGEARKLPLPILVEQTMALGKIRRRHEGDGYPEDCRQGAQPRFSGLATCLHWPALCQRRAFVGEPEKPPCGLLPGAEGPVLTGHQSAAFLD